MIISLFYGCTDKKPVDDQLEKPKTITENVNKIGTLKGSIDVVDIARTEEILNEWKEVENKEGTYYLDKRALFFKYGDVFSCPTGDKVLILEDNKGNLRVDVITGSRKGKSGWIDINQVAIDGKKIKNNSPSICKKTAVFKCEPICI